MYYRPKTQIKQQLSKKLKTQKSQGKSLSGTISKTSNTNDNKQQHKINELEEEISRLKTTQKITETTNIDETKIIHHKRFKKQKCGLCKQTEARKKTLTYSK